jgi:archaellum component FlaC|tara:strand:+ start:197 stop:427 length:231 start_codon:yes stop_codon:yes gene_type:complete
MEYAIVGSVLSLLVSMKFADYKTKEAEEKIKALQANVELVTTAVQTSEKEAPKKTLMIVAPVAKAVKELQTAIGVQ